MPVSVGTPPAPPSKVSMIVSSYGSTTSTSTTTLSTGTISGDIGAGKLTFFGINDAGGAGNAEISVSNAPTSSVEPKSEDDEALFAVIIKDPTTATKITYFKFTQAAGITTGQATGIVLNAAESIFITGKTTAGTGYYNFNLTLTEV